MTRPYRPAAVFECACPCGALTVGDDQSTTVTCGKCGTTGAIVWGAAYLAIPAPIKAPGAAL